MQHLPYLLEYRSPGSEPKSKPRRLDGSSAKTSVVKEAGGGRKARPRNQPASSLLSFFLPPFVQRVHFGEATGISEILQGGELPGAALLFFSRVSICDWFSGRTYKGMFHSLAGLDSKV